MKNLPIYAGLGIVIGTHVWLFNDMTTHAAVNLAAAGLIIYGLQD